MTCWLQPETSVRRTRESVAAVSDRGAGGRRMPDFSGRLKMRAIALALGVVVMPAAAFAQSAAPVDPAPAEGMSGYRVALIAAGTVGGVIAANWLTGGLITPILTYGAPEAGGAAMGAVEAGLLVDAAAAADAAAVAAAADAAAATTALEDGDRHQGRGRRFRRGCGCGRCCRGHGARRGNGREDRGRRRRRRGGQRRRRGECRRRRRRRPGRRRCSSGQSGG